MHVKVDQIANWSTNRLFGKVDGLTYIRWKHCKSSCPHSKISMCKGLLIFLAPKEVLQIQPKNNFWLTSKLHQERMIGLCSSSGKGWLGNGQPGQYNMTFDTKQQKGEKHGENHWPPIDKWCCFLTRLIHFLQSSSFSQEFLSMATLTLYWSDQFLHQRHQGVTRTHLPVLEGWIFSECVKTFWQI